jgi:hypothetical protein
MKGRIVACALSLMVLSACNYTSSSNPAGSTTGKTAVTFANSSVTTGTDATPSEPATESTTTAQPAAAPVVVTTVDLTKPKTVAQAANNAEAMASQAEADAAAMDTATP